jgi:hypothetical protein
MNTDRLIIVIGATLPAFHKDCRHDQFPPARREPFRVSSWASVG